MTMKVVWSSGFKRSFKKITQKNSRLSDKIIETLNLLAIDPFTPSLKSHKLIAKWMVYGLVLFPMIVELFSIFPKMVNY
jgi:mRNA-degrading endonuclease YafQ of YafQ-DinJ toxin-antitoxin module